MPTTGTLTVPAGTGSWTAGAEASACAGAPVLRRLPRAGAGLAASVVETSAGISSTMAFEACRASSASTPTPSFAAAAQSEAWQYTSARLISWHKTEFAYGRIESRILVPDGENGLWPAFWSLGTDIGLVGWPRSGEIDLVEYVSRLPHEVFGTIHGPGYAGGASFGRTYTFPEGVSANYHTFSIEW